jgi:hypothetical protein
MLRLRATIVFAVLLAPVVLHAQSDPTLWRFAYPDAKALIGIDWSRIRESPAGSMIREKWLTADGAPVLPGMELLDGIDRVLISSPGKNTSDDAAESPILIAIRGHFDAAKVRQVFTHFGARPQSYNSFQVYRPQAKDREGNEAKNTAWVLFDPETILYGDAQSIFRALDRNQFAQSLPASGPLVAHAGEMDANYEFWMIIDATELTSNDQVAALFRGGEWASEAQAFEAGVNLSGGLTADITVRFSSDVTAKRVTAELTRVMNLAARDKSAGAQLQDIAKKLKFTLDGSATKISLRLTEQELEKSAEAFAASRKASAKLAGNTAPVANPVPAPAPVAAKPGVIRIEGLDDGPREIPFPDPGH